MKQTFLDTALANMTGAVALGIMLGSGVVLAADNDASQGAAFDDQTVVQDTANENLQANFASRNENSLNDNSVDVDASREQEAERGGQLANNGGRNYRSETEIETEDDHSFEQEAERGGMAANNGGTNTRSESEVEIEQEAERGGQLANNGGRNYRSEVDGSFNDESQSLTIGDVAVLLNSQNLSGYAAAVHASAASGDVDTGSIMYGADNNKMAAGNLTSSNNTGIGSNALAVSAVQANGRISID